MNPVYLFAPLLGMSIFGGIYSKYARIHAARAAELHQSEVAARAAKKASDDDAKSTALEAARLSQIRRTDERAEKHRIEEDQKQARLALEEQGRLAATEVARLRSVVSSRRREFDELTTNVGLCEKKKHQLQQRESAILQRLERSEAHRDNLVRLLNRMGRSEDQREASLTTDGTSLLNPR